jgi:hypothetical protein
MLPSRVQPSPCGLSWAQPKKMKIEKIEKQKNKKNRKNKKMCMHE